MEHVGRPVPRRHACCRNRPGLGLDQLHSCSAAATRTQQCIHPTPSPAAQYPNPKQGAPSAFQMAAVLLTGNGVPWQLFNSIWESLPFR